MTIAELVAKLEKATGPDRDLDAAIDHAAGFREYVCLCGCAPHYTRSLDAALTLVPEGAEYSISTLYGVASVELPLNLSDALPEHVSRPDGNVILAVVTAALRARGRAKSPTV